MDKTPAFIAAGVFVLIVIANIVSYALMGVDKKRARRDEWRISERTLFLAAICFGALGGVLGMNHFRHKTNHWYFRLFFPLLLVGQIALIIAGIWYFFIR